MAIAGARIPLAALELVDPKKLFAENPKLHWVFLVDTTDVSDAGCA